MRAGGSHRVARRRIRVQFRLLGDGQMPALHQRVFDLAQPRPHPLCNRDPLQREAPLPRLRADVREAEEVERLRPTVATRLSFGGEPSELDQARLLRVQLQRERREPFAQVNLEPLRVLTMLKAHDEVVREAHDHYVAVRVARRVRKLVRGSLAGRGD
jgi:hypothetical protein